MTEVPENVYAQAREIVAENDRHTDDVLMVARAIMAERERCARVVERGLGRTNTYIANAVRSGDAP